MAERDGKFLARWSQRKLDAEVEAEASEKPAPAAAAAESPPEEIPEETPEEARRRLGLPEIESLEDSSDFTQFMAEGVPEVLRRRALRRLWRLNPLYANLDGLAEYDEDFRDAGALATAIKTVYEVGKGTFDKDEPAPAAQSAPGSAPASQAAEPQAAEPQGAEPQGAESQGAESQGAESQGAESQGAAEPSPEETPRPAPETEAEPAPGPHRRAARRRWGDAAG